MDILAWYWTGLGPEGTTRRAITGFAGSKRGVSSLLGDPKSRLLWAAPECVFLGEPVIADWSSDPRAGGSYSLIGPGQKAGLAVMRVPFGRVCLAGEHVNVIDPAPAIARHLASVLRMQGLLSEATAAGEHHFFTSASGAGFQAALARLVGHAGMVTEVRWVEGTVTGGSGGG